MTENAARTVLVTGTSSGIGLATAVACAQAGWTTVATLRDPARSGALLNAAKVAGVKLDVRVLDVTDPLSVTACVEAVLADYGRLDAVINNAGSAHVGTLENDDLADIRACMEVNFFGMVHVSRAAMAHLRATRGRLLTVTSVGGAVGQPFNEAYCAAKFATEGFLQSLAPVSESLGVQVCVVEPGGVTSEFVANAKIDVPAMLATAGPYAPALAAYVAQALEVFESDDDTTQTPEQVGDAIAALLDADVMPFRVQTSAWARAFVGASLADLDGSEVLKKTRGWLSGHVSPTSPTQSGAN